MSEQSGFYIFWFEIAFEQDVVFQKNLRRGKIIRESVIFLERANLVFYFFHILILKFFSAFSQVFFG